MSKRRDIVLRITEYLSNGGLFNPELMPHSDVRDLLLACRDEIIAARACAEMMLQGTGQKLGEELARRVMDEHYPPRWIPVDEMLPEDETPVLVYCIPRDDDGTPSCAGCDGHGGIISTAWYERLGDGDGEHWVSDGLAPPLFWMPLPEPPDEAT